MMIAARQLHTGDVVHQNDWPLHVTAVEAGRSTVAVAVEEFGFLLHFPAGQPVEVDEAPT